MNILNTVLTSLFSIVTLFLYTKLMGYRELSQLSMFDYVNGITIGSIAAELAIGEKIVNTFVAMTIYAACIYLLSVATEKSVKTRRLVNGRAFVLFDNEKFLPQNMKKARIDINEFLTECRSQGYFNIDDISTAIMEVNGKISILPKADKRPLNLSDMNITPPSDGLCANVIICGNIMENNMIAVGVDMNWLSKNLKGEKIENVFLATCDINKKLSIYKYGETTKKDTFFM